MTNKRRAIKRRGNIRTGVILVLLAVFICIAQPSQAALRSVGPPSPANGFPSWYQDFNGLSLAPCLDQNGFCVLPVPFDPLLTPPASFTTIWPGPASGISDLNFPLETFFWSADSTMTGLGPTGRAKAVLHIGLEGSFPVSVINGQQLTFIRINLKAMGPGSLTPSSTFTVIHPYGSFTFSSDALGAANGGLGNQAFRVDDPAAPGALAFDALLPAAATGVGPFLTWPTAELPVKSPDGNTYIGNPATPHAVIGSPTGQNIFRIDGPDIGGPGVNTTQTNLFTLAGKMIGMQVTPGTISFFPQRTGIASAPRTVTVSNAGGTPLQLDVITITGLNAADFAIPAATNGCTTPVPAGGSCTFQVIFTGAPAGGNSSATVNIPVISPAGTPPGAVSVNGITDNTPLDLTYKYPADGATGVPINTSIIATFSKLLKDTSINTSTFKITTGGIIATGATVTFDAASKTATLTPSSNLVFGATYTATVAGVTDIAGNPLTADVVWTFIANGSADAVGPTVSASTPATNTKKVSADDVITVTFNEPVSVASINATTFTLSNGVTGTVTYDPPSKTATFTPSSPLAFGTAYTATVTTGVQDLAKNPMAANYTLTFFTDFAPTQPELLEPGNGAAGASTSVNFAWHKSTDSDGDPITYHLYYCNNQEFIGCPPVDIVPPAAATANAAGPGLGGYGAGMLLAGVVVAGGLRGRKRILLLLAVVLLGGGLIASSCSSNSGRTPDPNRMENTVTGLIGATQYYWKVVADDGGGGTTSSEIWSFKTQ